MFANPLWSVALLLAPFFLYFVVIRPRLKAKFLDTYAHIDSFWARLWARVYAFRSLAVGVVGVIAAALPDILVAIAPLDFSAILPQPWGLYVGTGVSITLAIMKAFETKPDGVQS